MLQYAHQTIAKRVAETLRNLCDATHGADYESVCCQNRQQWPCSERYSPQTGFQFQPDFLTVTATHRSGVTN